MIPLLRDPMPEHRRSPKPKGYGCRGQRGLSDAIVDVLQIVRIWSNAQKWRNQPRKLPLVRVAVIRYIATLPGEGLKTSSTQVSLKVPSYLAALIESRRQSVACPFFCELTAFVLSVQSSLHGKGSTIDRVIVLSLVRCLWSLPDYMFPKNGSAISSRSRVPSDSITNTCACGSHRTHIAKRPRLSERPRRLCTCSLEIVRRLYTAKEA